MKHIFDAYAHAQKETHIASADTVVVFIHGILGSPAHFDFLLAHAHAAGVSTASLLLPGHGGAGIAFAKTDVTQWKNYVLAQIEPLTKRYKRVLLYGHSMGCLLSIYAARALLGAVHGMFFLALPLHIRLSWRAIALSFTALFSRKETPQMAAVKVSYSIAPTPLYVYVRWLPNFIRLLRFAKETRRQGDFPDIETVCLFSAHDELVPPCAARAAQKHLHSGRLRCEELPHSGHYLYDEHDLARMTELFLAWLSA